MNVSVYMKGNYEEFCGFGQRKNKAKQSQFTWIPAGVYPAHDAGQE